MKKRTIVAGCALLWCAAATQAQESINAGGGTATGTAGSASYSVGQAAYTTTSSATGTLAQGVQHAYEIWTISALSDASNIALSMIAYPNPTSDQLQLTVDSFETASPLSAELFDASGKSLVQRPITTSQTSFELTALPAATYYLKVRTAKEELKCFKIIKN